MTCVTHPFVVFSLLVSTDMLDGWVARMWEHETQMGKWLDPLADKIVLASVVFPLVYVQVMHWAIALVFILREFIVLAVRHIAALSGIHVHVSRWGKMKTVFQFTYIALCLISDMPVVWYTRFVCGTLALAMTIGSMLQYVYQCTRVLYKGSA